MGRGAIGARLKSVCVSQLETSLLRLLGGGRQASLQTRGMGLRDLRPWRASYPSAPPCRRPRVCLGHVVSKTRFPPSTTSRLSQINLTESPRGTKEHPRHFDRNRLMFFSSVAFLIDTAPPSFT